VGIIKFFKAIRKVPSLVDAGLEAVETTKKIATGALASNAVGLVICLLLLGTTTYLIYKLDSKTSSQSRSGGY
jgi:hypothetical protein